MGAHKSTCDSLATISALFGIALFFVLYNIPGAFLMALGLGVAKFFMDLGEMKEQDRTDTLNKFKSVWKSFESFAQGFQQKKRQPSTWTKQEALKLFIDVYPDANIVYPAGINHPATILQTASLRTLIFFYTDFARLEVHQTEPPTDGTCVWHTPKIPYAQNMLKRIETCGHCMPPSK
jgi:hypothetical protein